MKQNEHCMNKIYVQWMFHIELSLLVTWLSYDSQLQRFRSLSY